MTLTLTLLLYGIGCLTSGFFMGAWVMYSYYTKSDKPKDIENTLGRYTIDWAFVGVITYILAVSFTALFLFMDFPSTIQHYKALSFVAITFGPLLFLLSFKRKT